ncbi:MAG: hypothetical protein AB8G99_15305 [Planctomycetaceae bacterium]
MNQPLLFMAVLASILTGTCAAQRPNVLPQLVEDVSQDADSQKQARAFYALLRVRIDETWDIDALETLSSSDHGHLRKFAATILRRVPALHKDRAIEVLKDQLAAESSCLTSSSILHSLSKLGELEASEATSRIIKRFEEQVGDYLREAKEDDATREFAIRLCNGISKDLCRLGDVRNGVRLWLMAQRLSKPNTQPPDTQGLPRKAAIELARIAQSRSNPGRGYAIKGLARFGYTNKAVQSNLLTLLTPTQETLKQDTVEETISRIQAPHTPAQLRAIAIEALGHLALDSETVIRALKPIVAENSTDSLVAACSLARLNDATGLKLLNRTLRDSKPDEAIKLLGIIGHLGPKASSSIEPITSLAFEEHTKLEHAAETCLARISEANPIMLLSTFDSGSDRTKTLLCEVFALTNKASVPIARELISRFDAASLKGKVAIASYLARTEQLPKSYVPKLLALLKSKDKTIRHAALAGLLGATSLPPEVLQLVIDMAVEDNEDTAVATYIVRDVHSLTRPLIQQLADAVPTGSEQFLRVGLAHHFNDIGATPVVLGLLKHEDTDVRNNALAALQKRPALAPPVVAAVTSLIDDQQSFIAVNAVRLFLHIDPTSPEAITAAKQLLDNPKGKTKDFQRAYLFKTLAKLKPIDEGLQQQALAYLDDYDTATRSAAAQYALTFDPESRAGKNCLHATTRGGTGFELEEALRTTRLLTPNDSRITRIIRMRMEDQNPYVQRWVWKAATDDSP